MTPRLLGKRALVTGAGRGIGRAIALILAEQGASVAISSRTLPELQETKRLAEMRLPQTNPNDSCTQQQQQQQQQHLSLHVADCTNSSEVDAMVQSLCDQWGGLDILINNAGGSAAKGSITELGGSDLIKVLQTNVVGPHTVASAVVRLALGTQLSNSAQDRRYIINVSSRAGKIGLPNMSFYVASKFALEGLTSTWAKELKDRNIVVHSISPGMVDTQSFPKKPNRPAVRTAESIKDGLMVLLSDHSAIATDDTRESETFNNNNFLTGCYLHVDELDIARANSLPDVSALKPIDEAASFDPLPPHT